MIVTNVLTFDIDELTEKEWRQLFRKLRYQAEGEIYEPWKVDPRYALVQIPRGAWNHVPEHVEYVDSRVFPPMPELEFEAVLDTTTDDGRSFEGQMEAATRILAEQQGLVVRPPGSGKTQIVLYTLAKVKTRSLVLVHTEDILQQWLDRINEFIPDTTPGVIRGSKFQIEHITVATVQTFRRRLYEDPLLAQKFGAVVLDEAHHAAASTFETILNEMWARYRIGVTATERRADGRHPYMKTVIGPIIYKQKFKSKVPVSVIPLKAHKFQYRMRGSWDWRNLLNKLIADETRNQIIAKNADKMIKKGHSTLVLSREIQHLKNIEAYMEEDCELLTGERTKALRKEILKRFREGEIKCLLATQLADEALDVPILSCVILTFPGKHDGRIVQQVGRALREHPGKTEAFILDVVDDRVGVLRRQWLKRKQAYKAMKIPVRGTAKRKLRRK